MPSVLGENAFGHLGHIVPFASSASGNKEAPEHWHAPPSYQEAEDVFDAFATPERPEVCNARFIFLALSRAQPNASHAQASYNSKTQLCNELSSKQLAQTDEEKDEIALAEPQRALGHTMSEAQFANFEAQIAMLTDLLRNLAPTANAAEGPLCILAIIMTAVCVRGCFGQNVGARPGNVLRGPLRVGTAGNGGTTEALRRAESMRSPPDAWRAHTPAAQHMCTPPSATPQESMLRMHLAVDGATHVHSPFNNTPSIHVAHVPQNPDSTGEDINNYRAPSPRRNTSKTYFISADTTGNAQIQAPVVPPLSDATSEPDNTSFPSPSPVEEMRSERPLKKRERESSIIKTESDGDVAVCPGEVPNMASVDGGTKDHSILISDSDSDDEVKPNPRKVQRVD